MVFTNKIQASIGLFVIVLLGAISFSSCNNDEGLPAYDNPNISDTSGKNINIDLFISGELDNIPFTYFNGINDYSNWTFTSEEGFCGNDLTRFVQVQTTAFIKPETIKRSFYIDFKACLSSDSLLESSRVDSVLVVGRYPYYPKFKENRTVVIRYIDENEILWTTSFGSNNIAFADFELSALIDNGYDINSEKIAFGRFEGYLYNGGGDSLKLKVGQFKGRIVK